MSSLVLLGAGASYGAGCTIPKAPPLGLRLFPELATEFPRSWGDLDAELTARFNANFEDGMNVLWESGSHAVPLLMQQMAVFFARYRLSPLRRDAYSRLIEAIRLREGARSITLSSLNYDCLLEMALSAAHVRIGYFAECSSDDTVAVWKLHGSCNFLPGNEVQATRAVSYGSGASFGTGIRAVNLDDVSRYCAGNTAMYPAMAIYGRGKPVQISAGIINWLQRTWARAVVEADYVAVIGVRPNPADVHIWEPLARSRGRLLYVGDRQEFDQWREQNRPTGDTVYVGPRFGDCIADLAESLAGR